MNKQYRIILVDDEDQIRGRIARLIENNPDFIVVGKAGNGDDAYELVGQLKPDVVLTDIKMPFVDGIELAKLLKLDYPTIKVAFISGYDEFKYAQEAINLDVVSYLMKPLKSSDINQFLHVLKERLDDEYNRKYNEESALKRYRDSLPFIIDYQFNDLLFSSYVTEDQVHNLQQHGLDVSRGVYLSGCLEIETKSIEIELVSLEKLRTLTEELLQFYFKNKPLVRQMIVQNGVFFIIKSDDRNVIKDVDAFLYELLQSAEQYLSLRVRAGVSNIFETINQLPLAYKEAKQAIGYGKFLNTGRIVYISEVENKKTMNLALSLDDITAIETTIKFGRDEEVKAIFKARNAAIKEDDADVLVDYEAYIVSLANIVIQYAHSMKADTTDIIAPGMLQTMMNLPNLDSVFAWTEDIIFRLRKRNIEKNISRTQRILSQALNIIETRYYEPSLSLNQVCDEVEISISYLSMLFQRHHKMTFNKYLIQVRMEKAKELLISTQDKIIDIALQCGYHEVYYFSHSFKKYTNLSPKHFRDKNNV